MPQQLNRAAFYKTVRARLGSLTQSQVEGFEAILDTIEASPLAHQAYMLGTAYHETAFTMQPAKERGGYDYYMRMYDMTGNRRSLAISMGNTMYGDGARYAGRGYVQLTWKVNYARAAKELGIDFVNKPDLAMDPHYAASIMLLGMSEGWFTGKRLSSYLPTKGMATRQQYIDARRIINGTDAAEKIEGYAQAFERALRDGSVTNGDNI